MTTTRLGLATATYEAPQALLDVVADVLEECIENGPEVYERSLEEFHIKIERRVERFADVGPDAESRDDLLHVAVLALTALTKIARETGEGAES